MKKEINFTSGKKRFCVLAAGLLLLSACGKGGQEEEQKQTGSAVVVTETDTVAMNLGNQCVAESEKGYYIWGYSAIDPDRGISIPMLLFKDKESGRIVPLCNRPDCAHIDEECNAYFPPESAVLDGGEYGVLYEYIQYYEGNLYVSGISADRYVSIYRIGADGSGDWELSTKVFRTDYAYDIVFYFPELLIADGYIYYVDWNQKCQTLERIPLGGNTAEVLYDGPEEAEGDILATQIPEVKNIEGFVYFLTISYLGDTAETANSVGGLYQCDMETGKCVKAKDGYGGPWTVHNGYVYYGGMDRDGLCRYSMREGVEEILSDEPIRCPEIALTDDYIIICVQESESGRRYGPESHTLFIYDYEGNKLATVANNIWMDKFYGGNSEILFGRWADETENGVCFMDLTLPLEELHWENFAVD